MPYYLRRQKGNFLAGCVMVPGPLQLTFTCTLKGKTHKRKARKTKAKERKGNATFSRVLIILSWEDSKPTDCLLAPLFFYPNRAVLLMCPSRSLLTCQLDKESIGITYICPVHLAAMDWQASAPAEPSEPKGCHQMSQMSQISQAAPLATGFLLIAFDAKSSSKIAKITREGEAAWSEQH